MPGGVPREGGTVTVHKSIVFFLSRALLLCVCCALIVWAGRLISDHQQLAHHSRHQLQLISSPHKYSPLSHFPCQIVVCGSRLCSQSSCRVCAYLVPVLFVFLWILDYSSPGRLTAPLHRLHWIIWPSGSLRCHPVSQLLFVHCSAFSINEYTCNCFLIFYRYMNSQINKRQTIVL